MRLPQQHESGDCVGPTPWRRGAGGEALRSPSRQMGWDGTGAVPAQKASPACCPTAAQFGLMRRSEWAAGFGWVYIARERAARERGWWPLAPLLVFSSCTSTSTSTNMLRSLPVLARKYNGRTALRAPFMEVVGSVNGPLLAGPVATRLPERKGTQHEQPGSPARRSPRYAMSDRMGMSPPAAASAPVPPSPPSSGGDPAQTKIQGNGATSSTTAYDVGRIKSFDAKKVWVVEEHEEPDSRV